MDRLPFDTIDRLPPYVFAQVNELKAEYRHAGKDIIDLGMGNPDQPTPTHIVDKLVEASRNHKNHRYSVSRGIERLRLEITKWYQDRFQVELDPDAEAIAVIGSKEGYSHFALATINRGDVVITQNPTYPIHTYGMVIAGAEVHGVPVLDSEEYLDGIQKVIKATWPKPKFIVASYPQNPTTKTVDLDFFKKLIEIAKDAGVYVIHDLAYADLTFDGNEAPSILQVPGAKDIAIEFVSMSKSYNMAGWRVGFAVGNPDLVGALRKIKSYLDYGMFQPIQIAAIKALSGPQDCVKEIRDMYQLRRDVLVESFGRAEWQITPPEATMFVWARIPDAYQSMGSLEFSKKLIKEAHVAVSPGVGFGSEGEGYVRLALVENEHRIRQSARNIRDWFNREQK
jgi:alanine-synthesizing transaminase